MRERAAYMRQYRAQAAARAADGGLLPFQSAFVSAVCRQDHPPEIAALSVPRGNGKSWLCGKMVARSLSPGDPLYEPAVENVLVGDRLGVRAGGARGVGRLPLEQRWRDPRRDSDAGEGNFERFTPGARARGERANCDCRRTGRMGSDDGPSAVGRDYHGTREASDDGCSGRDARPGTVDGSGVVVACVCGGGELRRAARLGVVSGPGIVDGL